MLFRFVSFQVAPLTKTQKTLGMIGATAIIIMSRRRSLSSSLSELSPDSDEISLVVTDDSDEEDSIDFSEP